METMATTNDADVQVVHGGAHLAKGDLLDLLARERAES
jgi:hypothetical protein